MGVFDAAIARVDEEFAKVDKQWQVLMETKMLLTILDGEGYVPSPDERGVLRRMAKKGNAVKTKKAR